MVDRITARAYEKKYRDKHKDKIRKRNKEKYQLNLTENRKYYKEYKRKYREKYPDRTKANKFAQYYHQRRNKCILCLNKEYLQFHHTNYEKNEGYTLCASCHKKEHQRIKNCGHEIIKRKGLWKHKDGGQYCQVVPGGGSSSYSGCLCNNPEVK